MKKIVICTFYFFMFFFHSQIIHAETTINAETEVNLEEGIYKITYASDPNMVLAIADASKKPVANVQLGIDISSPSQYFAIIMEYDGWYTLRNLNSQLNLDVADASSQPHTNLQQYINHKNDAQHFKFYDAGDQQVYIQSKLGTCIDLFNGELTVGNNIQLNCFNGSYTQKWTLTPIAQTLSSIEIEDGNYIIYSESDNHLAVSVTEASKIAGTDVQIDRYVGSASQIYTIKKEFDGWYSIKNTNSQLYLDVRNANETNPTSLQQWIGTGQHSQKFKFYDAGNGAVVIETKYGTVMGFSDENNSSQENNIQMTLYTGADSQLWKLKPIQ